MALPKIGIPYYDLELVSGKKIQYRPFTVKEEKALLLANESKDKSATSNAIRNTLNACIKSDDEQENIKVEDLPMFDVELLFLHIRMASVGEMSEFNYTCYECENEPVVKAKLDLRDIIIENKESTKDNKIMINDEIGIEMEFPKFSSFLERNILSDSENNSSAIVALNMIGDCVSCVYDKEQIYTRKDFTKKEMDEFIDSLTQDQLKKVNAFFEKIPKLTYNLKVQCPCGVVSEKKLEGIADFFM